MRAVVRSPGPGLGLGRNRARSLGEGVMTGVVRDGRLACPTSGLPTKRRLLVLRVGFGRPKDLAKVGAGATLIDFRMTSIDWDRLRPRGGCHAAFAVVMFATDIDRRWPNEEGA